MLDCPGLQNNAGAVNNQNTTQRDSVRQASSPDENDVSSYGPAYSINGAANALDGATAVLNGTPLQNRPSLPPAVINGSSVTPGPRPTPKPKPIQTPKQNTGANIPAPELADVHGAFVEVRRHAFELLTRLTSRSLEQMRPISVCPYNASTATKFERRTRQGKDSICLNVRHTSM